MRTLILSKIKFQRKATALYEPGMLINEAADDCPIIDSDGHVVEEVYNWIRTPFNMEFNLEG